MTIDRNKMVSLTYNLRLGGAEGELIEQASTEQPLKFLFGAGLMLPMFESHLIGKTQGDKFEILLNSQEAYGERDEDAVVELPKEIFIVNGEFNDELIAVGNSVPMMSQGGQRMNGIVLDVTDEHIKMDFNHPLAGDTLHFTGNILEVRDASEEEIAATLGGGCSGSCGGSCSCDDGCGDHERNNGSCGCH